MQSVAYSVSDILNWTGGRLANESFLKRPAADIRLRGVAGLRGSRADQVSFFFSAAYKNEIPFVGAGVLVTGEAFIEPLRQSGLPLWSNTAIISCKDPYLAMALLSEKFAAFLSTAGHVPGLTPRSTDQQIAPSAVIHPTAKLGSGVVIGPHCVIEENAVVGDRCTLYKGCYLGPGAKLGEDCVLFPNVVVYEWCELGKRVRIHANSVIGGDGFGYAPRTEGGKPVEQVKIYHLGRVIISDDVEVGSLTSIDRGTLNDTRVLKGAKIDNNVQVGHNATVGEGSIVCGGVCLAGSSTLGKFVYMGGLSAVNNGVVIHDYVKIGPGCMIPSDVSEEVELLGFPPRPAKDFFRAHILMSRMLAESRPNRKPKA